MKKSESLVILLFYFYLLSFSKCFLISVIMAIYNTGRYLDDSIGSLYNQTIGFSNIQIILVNDGSIDNSEQICLKYQKLYSKNIIYINIEHSGVSKARNIGMNYAIGQYINFLDPDDKWDSKAFKYILLFFKLNKDIDFVAGRLKFFEAKEEYHPLDYKYYKTRKVNLTTEYNCIQLSASCCIFKKSLIIKHNYFKEGVFSGEDARFVLNILLFNPIMGIIKEALYLYRRRADSTSMVQNQRRITEFYFDTITSVIYYLINSSKVLYNKIVPFVQYYIGYDVIFRIQSLAYKYLDHQNYQKYNSLIEELLNIIDDKYILEQKVLTNYYKMIALSKKYKKDLRNEMIFENNSFIYLKTKIVDLNLNVNIISWKIIDIKDCIIHLEGKDNFWMPRENYFYFCKLGNKTIFPKYFEYSYYDFLTMNGIEEKGRIILFDIPFDLKNLPLILNFFISYKGKVSEIFTSFGFFSHIPPISHGYYISNNLIIKYLNNRLLLYQYNEKLEFCFETLYCHVLKNKEKNQLIDIRQKYRNQKNKINNDKKLEYWIINDDYRRAGDNGEYFFRFLKMKKQKDIKVYFAINGDCLDYQRLKKLENILDLKSEEYINIFLKADKIITSTFNSWAFNPFQEDHKYLRDILNFDIVFLNNGIIKDDLSKYLNRFNAKFNLFVTSSMKEYNTIISYKYAYNENNVILTGLPRFDGLETLKSSIQKEKIILVLPTWRMNIQGTMNKINYKIIHSDTFILTEFFQFYNNLMNHKDLIAIMNQLNYKGIFCLHPIFASQWIDFNPNEIFTVLKNCNYQKLLLKSSLLITDYSSVFFDFGYLKKPVIYIHFDYLEYRNSHYAQGYFDYIKDGFGPICKDVQCVFKEIEFELKNNCLLKRKYLKRINRFFQYTDANNNERIYKAIKNSKNRKIKNKTSFIYVSLNFISIILLYKFIKII